MRYFLALTGEARVLVVAGFHTGREKVVGFFMKIRGGGERGGKGRNDLDEDDADGDGGREGDSGGGKEGEGLVIERIYEMDVAGKRRAWTWGGREGESGNAAELKRWMVVAVLKWSEEILRAKGVYE